MTGKTCPWPPAGLLALPALVHEDVNGAKLQVQQEMGYISGRLAVGPRQFSYISMTRPRTPRVRRLEREGGACHGWYVTPGRLSP
ncbi:MAG: hypothetical protein Q8M19_23315, partial [Reyranella sp.]|nr:hypothetical protein [Reyranella sp.]